jgi:nucleotide-binding universal stress UspA family protein
MSILICYDGSADAHTAIEIAGSLFSGQKATILTVWEGLSEVIARTGAGFAAAPLDFENIDQASLDAARERADEGCALARVAGLDARPETVRQNLTVWGTIIDHAEALDAEAIVLGTRGLTGVKSLLLGSVSSAVLQHADRPVLVVPGAEVAHRRAARRPSRESGSAG